MIANVGEELGQRAALSSRVMKVCQCPLQDRIECQVLMLCGDTVLQLQERGRGKLHRSRVNVLASP